MDQTQDFKSLQDKVQAALISTTRTSGQIASEDLGFQRSLNPDFGELLDEQSSRLLALTSSLLKSAASLADLNVPVLEEVEDVDNNWRSVVDIVDSLLEKTDICLDEYTGLIKRKAGSTTPSSETTKTKSSKQMSPLGNSFRTQNLAKPQLAFKVKPDNHDISPWKPLLETKPHALVPLKDSLGIFTNDFDQKQYDYADFLPLLILKSESLSKRQRSKVNLQEKILRYKGGTISYTNNLFRYRHPYETEIIKLQYPEAVYQKAEPISYLPVDTTSAIFVDTPEGVLEMLEELKSATEIAVDLEHHDARSYVGLVSLMQISTRNKDWIVDTLKPWRQDLQVLNEVFTDPKIIKVFHGAYMDIMWLQRDLGLYVVGLFDTHYASRSLGYQGGSLAFLLKKFIDFDADKKYQLADWRIRPIPEEMFFYARSDTHFLLYIYDMMRNELIDRSNPEVPDENRIEIVLQKSKETSLIRFERQIYNAETGKGPGGWYQLLVKTPALFNNEQFAVFRAIHAWRDKVARDDDDSTNFLMPNHLIFTLAKLMPTDMVALLGLAHPISHSVKSRTGELLNIIKTAKSQGKNGPSMMDVLRPNNVREVSNSNQPSVVAKPARKSLVAVIDDEDLRSEKSAFWGGAFGSSIWDSPAPSTTDSNLRLAVPLPALSSEVFAPNHGLTDRSRFQNEPVIPTFKSEPVTPIQKDADEAFVIKRGSKRKSDEISDEEEDSNQDDEYDISLVDLDTQEEKDARKAKKLAKKQKRLRKEEKRAAKAAAAEAKLQENEDEEEAFDYSKAESVLHGKRSGDQSGGKQRKKPFDPYAKSADAPKGMRRLQTERPGKSHTFKS